SKEHSILLDTVRDIERIGDHFKNIIELIDYKKSNKIIITDSAQEDLKHMFEWTISTVQLAVQALDKMDEEAATKVIEMEKEIDRLERDNRKRHIIRMNKGLCDGASGIVSLQPVNFFFHFYDLCSGFFVHFVQCLY